MADLGHVGLPSRAPTFQNWRRVPAKPHEAPNLMSAPLRLSKAMAFSFTLLRPSEAPRLSVLPRCAAPLRPGDSVLPHCGAQCSPLRPAEAPPLSVARMDICGFMTRYSRQISLLRSPTALTKVAFVILNG